jgi:hypothetical protein
MTKSVQELNNQIAIPSDGRLYSIDGRVFNVVAWGTRTEVPDIVSYVVELTPNESADKILVDVMDEGEYNKFCTEREKNDDE